MGTSKKAFWLIMCCVFSISFIGCSGEERGIAVDDAEETDDINRGTGIGGSSTAGDGSFPSNSSFDPNGQGFDPNQEGGFATGQEIGEGELNPEDPNSQGPDPVIPDPQPQPDPRNRNNNNQQPQPQPTGQVQFMLGGQTRIIPSRVSSIAGMFGTPTGGYRDKSGQINCDRYQNFNCQAVYNVGDTLELTIPYRITVLHMGRQAEMVWRNEWQCLFNGQPIPVRGRSVYGNSSLPCVPTMQRACLVKLSLPLPQPGTLECGAGYDFAY